MFARAADGVICVELVTLRSAKQKDMDSSSSLRNHIFTEYRVTKSFVACAGGKASAGEQTGLIAQVTSPSLPSNSRYKSEDLLLPSDEKIEE